MNMINIHALLEMPDHYVNKSWGAEYWLENNDKYCLKLMYLAGGKVCSFHFHAIKKETFIGVSGEFKLFVGYDKTEVIIRPGYKITIDPSIPHKFLGIAKDSYFLEVSTHHEDSDSYRIEEK